MKKLLCLIILSALIKSAFAQPIRIAILDFDNISGIAKYDGLGKAMSSMLISDIESNVSSKRMQLVERAQINKIMKEQNLQKTASFDKNTSVKMGKLLGVNFILIGDIYILDNNLVINARLTDVSSGDIKFSEKQEGKVNEWLTIKTKLGKGVATNLSIPFTEPRIPDAIVAPAVLTTYASAIEENDKGNFEKAETLISTAKEFNPDFGYLDDLKDEVEKLKKQIAKNTADIKVLNKIGGRVVNAQTLNELFSNIKNPLSPYVDRVYYLKEILKFSADSIETLVGTFSFLSMLPAGVELLLSYKNGDRTIKTLELYNKDLSFIDSNFRNNQINKITFSHYVFYYLRSLAKNKLRINDENTIKQAINVSLKLEDYNKQNYIQNYNIDFFGGELSYKFLFGDSNTSIKNLTNLLKE
jgi:TolB-like protein